MANFGLSKPMVAPYNVSDGTESYGDVIEAGEAVNTSVTPKKVEAKLYGDNKTVEYVNEFVEADLALGTTRVPVKMATVMFGHTVTDNGTEVSNANDAAPYMGYAFITKQIELGVVKFRGCFLPKVQMTEGAEEYETKGENVQFKTPSLSGKAMARLNGDWRVKSQLFASEQEAVEWCKKQFKLKTTYETVPTDLEASATA